MMHYKHIILLLLYIPIDLRHLGLVKNKGTLLAFKGGGGKTTKASVGSTSLVERRLHHSKSGL